MERTYDVKVTRNELDTLVKLISLPLVRFLVGRRSLSALKTKVCGAIAEYFQEQMPESYM